VCLCIINGKGGIFLKQNNFYSFLAKGSAFFLEPINGKGLYLRVYYLDGTIEDIPTSVISFLTKIVNFFGNDLTALRKQYGQAIGKNQLVPLPLSEEWILTPLKLAASKEGEYLQGWVVAQSILGIESVDRVTTRLQLKGNHTVYCGHRIEFCHQQLRNVALVQHRYQILHGKGMIKEGVIPYF